MITQGHLLKPIGVGALAALATFTGAVSLFKAPTDIAPKSITMHPRTEAPSTAPFIAPARTDTNIRRSQVVLPPDMEPGKGDRPEAARRYGLYAAAGSPTLGYWQVKLLESFDEQTELDQELMLPRSLRLHEPLRPEEAEHALQQVMGAGDACHVPNSTRTDTTYTEGVKPPVLEH